MDSDELRKLRQFYHSLLGQQRILEGISGGVVRGQAILPLEDELRQLNEEFPSLMPPFNKHNYYSHNTPDGKVIYNLTAIQVYVAMALGRLQIAIEQPTSIPVTEKRQFAFVSDSALRTIIERDYAEIQKAYISECWKSVIILCGGAIEAILTDLLILNETAAKATISSLTGITYRWYCKGRIHVGTSHNAKRRMLCYNRSKGWDCPQKSALLEVYEYQIEQYLEMFHIPEDYQAKILEAHKKLQTAYDDTEKEQTRLKAQLERLKKLFAWGDLSEKQYLAEKENTLETLRALTPPETKSRVLEGLAEFLKNVAKAWREANQEHRNKLARQLFDEIWVKDKQVIAVKPRTELKPFFQLSYEEWLKKFESENSTPLRVATENTNT